MIPWQVAPLTMLVGILVGLGIRMVVDYAELAAYRRLSRRPRAAHGSVTIGKPYFEA